MFGPPLPLLLHFRAAHTHGVHREDEPSRCLTLQFVYPALYPDEKPATLLLGPRTPGGEQLQAMQRQLRSLWDDSQQVVMFELLQWIADGIDGFLPGADAPLSPRQEDAK